VFILDENGIIRVCNKAFLKFIDQTRSMNVIGKFIYEFLPDFPAEDDMWTEEIWKSFYRNQSISFISLENKLKMCIIKPTEKTI
jgi:PAS domain-containing protein